MRHLASTTASLALLLGVSAFSLAAPTTLSKLSERSSATSTFSYISCILRRDR